MFDNLKVLILVEPEVEKNLQRNMKMFLFTC